MSGAQSQSAGLQPLELLRVLREHNVGFLVIGGVAVAAHRYVRGTKDVDIIPEPSRANLERLLAALTTLDARQDSGDLRAEDVPVRLDLDGLAQGGRGSAELQNAPGRRDRHRRDRLRRTRRPDRDEARAAGRDLDHVDIRPLEEARGSAG